MAYSADLSAGRRNTPRYCALRLRARPGAYVLPTILNVYILVDPSKGAGARSDRTGIAAIGTIPLQHARAVSEQLRRMRGDLDGVMPRVLIQPS
jgi:hypothetical protein